jgi:hypothetical protein
VSVDITAAPQFARLSSARPASASFHEAILIAIIIERALSRLGQTACGSGEELAAAAA